MPHPALTQLRALHYFAAMPPLDAHLRDWLLLEDSMTKRFEQQGKKVSVIMVNEGFVGRDALAGEAPLLPSEPATGCGKSFFAPTVNPGWPGAR